VKTVKVDFNILENLYRLQYAGLHDEYQPYTEYCPEIAKIFEQQRRQAKVLMTLLLSKR
jgi:hypothetical protein